MVASNKKLESSHHRLSLILKMGYKGDETLLTKKKILENIQSKIRLLIQSIQKSRKQAS